MKNKLLIISFLLFAGIMIPNAAKAQSNSKVTACDFRADMRKVWEDHIVWTRNVILNIIDELPGTNEAVARLLSNQVDIGNAIKPYYGDAAGDQLTALLTQHIIVAADILTALKAGDTSAFNTAYTNWFLNADSIAAFLASANPNWDLAEMTMMMHDHLDATTAEVLARLNADYAADITAYDNVHEQILAMADMLAEGIVAQFPNKFKGANFMRNSQTIILEGSDVYLEQNSPNPFSEQTVINYFIPETISEAHINIYDYTNRLVKTVTIEEKGEGEIIINAHNLSNGIYTYSIIADGKIIGSKKMMHKH